MKSKKVIFSSIIYTYFRLFLCYLRKKQLLPPYPPHLKNVTALPCTGKLKLLHLTAGNATFLLMLVTLKRAGFGLALVALKMTDQRDKKNDHRIGQCR